MALLLRNAHLVDPLTGIDQVSDMLIRDGHIVEVGPSLPDPPKGIVKDLSGKYLVPGLVDCHVHFRDPGYEYKETVETGMRAAAKGGFTGVVPMANTNPVIDDGSKIAALIEKAAYDPGRTKVYPLGACTKNIEGKELAEMGDMVAKGALAFSDDGRGIQDGSMMRKVMDYAKMFGKPVLSHCQMEDLSAGGVVNEGIASTRLGLSGWPAVAEEVQIDRDILLAQLTGCHIHIQHITTAAGAEMIRRAKEEGIPVSAEVTPHHLFLNEECIDGAVYDTNFKMNPPLRTKEDNEALIQALLDGTIDMISTDHAPHAPHEKALEFDLAPFGITGLETALGLVLTNLVNTGRMTWQQLVERMAIAPRELLGLEQVRFEPGSVADLTVIDPNVEWTVKEDEFESKSRNSAFIGVQLKGRATDVYTEGYASLEDGKVTF